jgi:hypothetical protein
MKRKIIRNIILFFTVLILFGICSFASLKFYYQDRLDIQTWVNDIYLTGQTVETANDILLKQEDYGSVCLVKNGITVGIIELNQIEYELNFTSDLNLLLTTQKQKETTVFSPKKQSIYLIPVVTYDEKKLQDLLKNLDFIKENKDETERKFQIISSQEGYLLLDETKDVLNKEYLLEVLIKAMDQREYTINIDSCYYDMEKTEEMRNTEFIYQKVAEFQNFHMTYVFTDTIWELTPSVVSDWISLDENGDFLFDEQGKLVLNLEKVQQYIDQLGNTFDTYGVTRTFQATRGESVTIDGGTYGNLMDREAEYEYLVDAFYMRSDTQRIPEFIKKAKYQGIDDIGKTYIEIDMTKQKMYYYKDGNCLVETDIVTGNVARNMETPARVCYVYAKQRNRTLRGPNYAAFVNYWMPVNGNIGIHDAKWRDEFGGDIYLTDGSHGCINTPYEKMKILYENVEIGTPVIMFY